MPKNFLSNIKDSNKWSKNLNKQEELKKTKITQEDSQKDSQNKQIFIYWDF